jgi:hypothetical protein
MHSPTENSHCSYVLHFFTVRNLLSFIECSYSTCTKSRNRQHPAVTAALINFKVDLRRQARKRKQEEQAKAAALERARQVSDAAGGAAAGASGQAMMTKSVGFPRLSVFMSCSNRQGPVQHE